MNIKNRMTLVCVGLVLSSTVHASGVYLYEIATEDMGLAGAGQAARAQDASTVYTNPAGMTRLPNKMITGGLQALYGDEKYTLDSDATLKGNSPGNVVGWFPASSFFYQQPINDSVSAGIGLYGNYGLALDFGNWAGDQFFKKGSLMSMTLTPAVAWKINDRLSLGLASGINYGFFSLVREKNNSENKQSDYDWALNWRLGLLFNATEQTRVGLTWNSQTKFNFAINENVNIPGITSTSGLNLPLSAQIYTPQQVMFSVVHDINREWSVLGDLGWQDWSTYGANEVKVNSQRLAQTNRLKDTWHTALGVQYRPNETWRFNTGVAFDSSFYRTQDDTSLTMPTGDTWRIGVGTQYQFSPSTNIGASFEYLNIDTSKVSFPGWKGEYRDPSMYFFGLNVTSIF